MTLVPVPMELPPWVSDLLQKMIVPAAEEVGLLGRDLVRYYRARIQIRFFEKFKTKCETAGLQLKHVSLPFLFDVIQRGTIEEDEELQERWANLLANAADSRGQVLVKTAFPDILRQISREEAVYLDELFEVLQRAEVMMVRIHEEGQEEHIPKLDPVSYDNLQRLRLIDADVEMVPGVAVTASLEELRSKGKQYKSLTQETYQLTFLGEAFVKACKTPQQI